MSKNDLIETFIVDYYNIISSYKEEIIALIQMLHQQTRSLLLTEQRSYLWNSLMQMNANKP